MDKSPFAWKMSQRPRKRPAHLNDYELGTPNKHSKTKRVLEEHSQGQEVNLDSGIKATEHSEPAESAMESSDENINLKVFDNLKLFRFIS